MNEVRIRLKVRELAEAKGWNAPKLARRIDMSNTPMYAIFDDLTRDPGILTLIKIARVLGVEVADLYEVVEENIETPELAFAA